MGKNLCLCFISRNNWHYGVIVSVKLELSGPFLIWDLNRAMNKCGLYIIELVSG